MVNVFNPSLPAVKVSAAGTGETAAASAELPVSRIPVPESLLSTLKTGHPRILASAEDFAAVKTKIATDSLSAQWYSNLKGKGEEILTQAPSKYELPDGVRLLEVSRKVLSRIYTLGMLHQLDGDPKYAARAWAELNAAAGFKDWNPAHYLDTAEMTHAFAIGYDWFYSAWSPEQKAVISGAIVQKGLNTALPTYKGEKIGPANQWFWLNTTNNWSLVVNGGISLGALAVADEQPELAEEILKYAFDNIQNGMQGYRTDGSYAEGVTYWSYATRYAVSYMAGLQNALGSDYGISELNGFPITGAFPVYLSGPRYSFNYGDADSAKSKGSHLFYLAKRFNNPLYSSYMKGMASGDALDLLWYEPGMEEGASAAPLDQKFGVNQDVTFRSAWNDSNALFVGFKGGDNQAGHNDLDLGTFIIDAMGERWAEEFGVEDYNVPGYWNAGALGERWNYYRKRAEGQNTIVMNPSKLPDQDPLAKAPLTRFEANAQDAFAVADLTAAYGPHVTKAARGVRFMDQRRGLLVQDEIEPKQPSDIWWFMHTKAEIKIAADGKSAMLQMGRKRMHAQILSPDPAQFLVMDSKPLWSSPAPAKQIVNSGVQKLAIRLKEAGNSRISVLFTPLTESEAVPVKFAPLQPVAEWKLAKGPFQTLKGIDVNGVPLTGFDPHKYTYYVPSDELPGVPVVKGYGRNNSRTDTTQAIGVAGTAVIKTTYLDNLKQSTTYKIHFVSGKPLPREPDGLPVSSVTASSHDGNIPQNTVDNSLATRWSAEGEQWIQYDLGQEMPVAGASVAWYNGNARSSKFDLQVSSDGSVWRNVYAGQSSGVTANPELYNLQDTTARYVKLLGHGNTVNRFNSISEVDLFETDEKARQFVDSMVQLERISVTSGTYNSVAVGRSVQLSVYGHLNNGKTFPIPADEVKFISSNDSVLRVDADGKLTGLSEGAGAVDAIYVKDRFLRYARKEIQVVLQGVSNITAQADTFVHDGTPAKNNGTAATLVVKDSNMNFEREAYMKFDLQSLAGEVESAVLHLYTNVNDNGGTEVETAVFGLSDDAWKENELTWNNRPARGEQLGTFHSDHVGGWRTVDLTSYVRDQAAGDRTVSLNIAQVLANQGLSLNIKSREDALYKPYLRVKMR
ncbi:CBM96 family carbohydrate-binding protein [Paenibacillus swuensis]|uniref:CBM96 family carbohydrate-binding protein n=1 Tax=Paenibacillus swuensis TaxID=1178515 RepID=UPI0018D3B9DC|nr:DNRLRE domain-containing protein [Paenibacillus swuensis]